jgi:hypothetical protein
MADDNIIDFPKSSAGRKIIRGLLQALRYSRGDTSVGYTYTVDVLEARKRLRTGEDAVSNDG